jgi:chemotaxis protein CheD
MRVVHVGQGDFAVSCANATAFATVLGSCVAVCLFDPVRGVGGMNHFLLPDAPPGTLPTATFGVHAMELLVNAVMRSGGERTALVAKTFGGANVAAGRIGVGARNATFVTDFLRDEGITCLAASLGGQKARRVWFHPATGRARMAFVDADPEAVAPAQHDVRIASGSGDLVLFS